MSHVWQGPAKKRLSRSGIGRLAEARREFRVAQAPADGGEHREMLALPLCRDQEEKDEIHRLVVDRVETDRAVEPKEHAERPIEPLDPGVREGEARAEPRRAERFAGLQGIENLLRIDADSSSRAGREITQQLFLVLRARAEDDGA